MEDKEPISCKLCGQSFETKSGLLRHISHKKVCRKHYGEEKFEDMRRNARLESKSNWNRKQTAKNAKRYQDEKEKRKKERKSRYVKAGFRKGYEDGRAFSAVFKQVFENCHENIGVDKLFDRSFDVVHDEAYSMSVDHVMESEDYQKIYIENTKDIDFDDFDEDYSYEKIAEEIEKAMKEAFENFSEIKINKLANDWTGKKENEIYYRCYERGETRAFAIHFDKFKSTIYKESIDNAMNEAFEKFDQDGVRVEQKIAKYNDGYYQRQNTSENNEFAKEIEKLLQGVFTEFQTEEVARIFNHSQMATSIQKMLKDMMTNEVRLIFNEHNKD